MNDKKKISILDSEWGNIFDMMCEEFAKEEDKRCFNDLLSQGKIKKPVLICNRKNKALLKAIMPNSYILATDLCEDKVYMVTDETIADGIREELKYESTKGVE